MVRDELRVLPSVQHLLAMCLTEPQADWPACTDNRSSRGEASFPLVDDGVPMQLSSLPQYVNNAKRFREIVRTLAKFGLAGWISDSHPDIVKNLLQGAAGERLSDFTQAERIRMALTELGTTFIKLGQMLSTRADLIGPELADELAKLQSNTPADPGDVVRSTITEELGKPPEELFAEFDLTAMASASIGQVHRATLVDGQAVDVKVQHVVIQERDTNDL